MSERNGGKMDSQIIEIREKQGKEFEETYSDFLSELKAMPKGTREEKEKRWNFFREYSRHDEFQIELIEKYRPGALNKLASRMEKDEQKDNQDLDIASYKHKKEMDPVVFMETLKKAIMNFTGVSKEGSKYGFVACIGTIYRQEAAKASAENEWQTKGMSDSEMSRERINNVLKLAKTVRNLWEKTPGMISLEEALNQILKEGKIDCRKKDLELVRGLVFHESVVCSLDQSMTEDGLTLEESLPDKRNIDQEVEEQDQVDIPFLENLEESWEYIESAKKLKEREFIRLFLTKGILKELKLDKNGEPFTEEPAGDEEFYNSLKPHGTVLYHKMFHEKYLIRAFIENPQNFYEVYARFLRRDFDFSDKLLAEVSGKDKSAVSRGRKNYQETMKALYKYYLNSK